MDGKPTGFVTLVGAGPGDPGLITRRGAEALRKAEVVVYDHLVHPRLLDLAPPSALRIFAGKSVGHCTMSQDDIHEVLIEHAASRAAGSSGSRGAIPTSSAGGPRRPLEYVARPPGVPFEIVPGVTAGVGATSAYAGVPDHASSDRVGRRFRHRPYGSGGGPTGQSARLVRVGAVPGDSGRLHGHHPPGIDLPNLDPRREAGRHAGGRRRDGDAPLEPAARSRVNASPT